ncbi:MAG: hypothetical protein DLM57_07805 [Pseudonocardiales bacterium]|nr:MAG: hypothetical protein DLM57_07805 [Pseudonocardiales bacterium]
MLPRVWHGAIAVLVVVGLIIQISIALRVHATPPSVAPGQLAGATLGGRLLRVASFFTIQSNILAAITSAQLARSPGRDGRGWRIARLDALIGITVTGIVYSTVLARMHEPRGWEQVSSNAIFHYVVPVMMVLGWLAFGPRPRITRATLLASLAFPILWFGYTLIHGATDGWYPYPFVDVDTHGYPRVLLNALLVTLVLGAVSALFWGGDRMLGRAPRAARPDRG